MLVLSVIFLFVFVVGGVAWALGQAPIGNHENEIVAKMDRDMAEAHQEMAGYVAAASVARARIELALGMTVHHVDKKQNAPTSLTLQ